MLSLLFTALLLAPDRAVAESVLSARVRPLTTVARSLIRDAAARSPTIAQLLFDLQQLDAIVYVELGWTGGDQGSTSVLTTAGRTRVLRVVVGARLEPSRRIEVLGHELSHALEIARAPEVRDQTTFRAFYERIGFAVALNAFETTAARDVERRVRAELGGSRR